MTKIDEIETILREVITQSNILLMKIKSAKKMAISYRNEMIDNELICSECGGALIKDRELVCSQCGLIDRKIMVSADENPYKDNTESDYQKVRKERQPKVRRRLTLSIYKSAHDALKELAENMTYKMYLSKLLAEAMCDELMTFERIKPETIFKIDVTIDVGNEFKSFCKKRRIHMAQAVSQIILNKFNEVEK